MKLKLISIVLSLAIVGCGDDDGGSTPNNPDASSGSDAAEATIDAGNTGADGSSTAGDCPADTLCLQLTPADNTVTSVPEGRLGVIFAQFFYDEGPLSFFIGYDVAVDPAAERIDIPLADIMTSTEDALFVCTRDCNDATTCPCTSDAKAALAIIYILPDVNQSGSMDLADIEAADDANIFPGVGYVILGFSETAEAAAPTPFEGLFTDGIQQSLHPYEVIEGPEGFDVLQTSDEGTAFPLYYCDPAVYEVCESMPKPNLT